MQQRCRAGKVEEARQIIDEMNRRGIKPDHISYNTLICGYSKRGDMNDAFKVRDEMLSIGFNPTLLTYNALIKGLCKNQEGDLAEGLLKEMVTRGIRPDDSTYYYLIEGIGMLRNLSERVLRSSTFTSANWSKKSLVQYTFCAQGLLAASVYCQEIFLLHFHSTDRVGPEGHYHWLLQLIVFASIMSALAETCFQTSLPAALALSISVAFQAYACLKFAGKCIPRDLLVEYEQRHSSRGADVPIAINDFKEAST
ncbi:hypothetical protein M0R45_006120 [Rubus argutus]|uniref:Pentatricopeptide repeat-containing protein n=1 Tax=Rubus argutus TaxID=59490 RepID=A0AAW1YPL8_RUBAR